MIESGPIVLTKSDYDEFGSCFEGEPLIRPIEREEPRTLVVDLQRMVRDLDTRWMIYYTPFLSHCILLLVASVVLSLVIE